jgi:hypothetical protein
VRRDRRAGQSRRSLRQGDAERGVVREVAPEGAGAEQGEDARDRESVDDREHQRADGDRDNRRSRLRSASAERLDREHPDRGGERHRADVEEGLDPAALGYGASEGEAECHRNDDRGRRLEQRERDDVRLLVGGRLARRAASHESRAEEVLEPEQRRDRVDERRAVDERSSGDRDEQRESCDREERGQRDVETNG